MMMGSLEIIFKLLMAGILGGLIGLEREASNRPAGLRTHILVTVGSALIMLVSMYGFEGNSDPARLAAQVVSGIGFLGAGTILRQGNNVQGLTTAASLWVCGGIGLAIGNGYYLGALVTAGIVLISLLSLGSLEKKAFKSHYRNMHIVARERLGLIGEIGTLMGENKISIKQIQITPLSEEGSSEIDIYLMLKLPYKCYTEYLITAIGKIEGVQSVNWEGEL